MQIISKLVLGAIAEFTYHSYEQTKRQLFIYFVVTIYHQRIRVFILIIE